MLNFLKKLLLQLFIHSYFFIYLYHYPWIISYLWTIILESLVNLCIYLCLDLFFSLIFRWCEQLFIRVQNGKEVSIPPDSMQGAMTDVLNRTWEICQTIFSACLLSMQGSHSKRPSWKFLNLDIEATLKMEWLYSG